MDKTDALKKAQAAYKKYSEDPNFKIVQENADVAEGWYWARFEGPEEDRPRELRRPVVFVLINEGHSKYNHCRVSKSYRRSTKFPCVGGHLDGQWVTEAEDYTLYNRNRRASRRLKVPTAVLVHLPSIKEP